MLNNTAFVALLDNITPIEGADKIVSADVILNGVKVTQIVVGVDTQPGTKIVYFDSNMCLDVSFIESVDRSSPDFGTEGFHSLGAYLGKNGRVRTIKLRGVISNGLSVNIEHFRKYDPKNEFNEGFSFTELNGVEICHKYVPPLKIASQSSGKKGKSNREKLRITPTQFHYHIDTEQLVRNIDKLNPDQIVSISRKVHGTSSIFSRTLVKRPLTLVEKVSRFLGAKIQDTVYGDIVSSRAVIKGIDIGIDSLKKDNTGFYKVDVWTDAGNKHFKGKLHDGETVYFEILGYLPGVQSMIQKGYDYGAKEGEYKIVVYRITMTGADDIVYEYGWQQMKARCKELDVPMVQEYFYGTITQVFPVEKEKDIDTWKTGLLTTLRAQYLEKDCPDCKTKVPDEGIVLRVEGLGIEVFKLKSEKFLVRESASFEKEEVDIEAEESGSPPSGE